MKTLVWHHSVEVINRLEQLGLSDKILREAIMVGEAHRNSCTANDPPMLSGLLAWGRTMRTLREFLVPRGWRKSDEDNYSTVVSDDQLIAIAVATGDDTTGRIEGWPRTKHPKGPATAAVVERNAVQLALFDLPSVPPRAERPQTEYLTWLLLIASSATEVRGELSLPARVGEDGRVEAWKERIILAPVQLDPEPEMDTVDEGPEIEVEVKRRLH